jgi:hypothetical protein
MVPLIGPFPDLSRPATQPGTACGSPKPGGERVLNRWAGPQDASRPISLPLAPFLPWLPKERLPDADSLEK